MAKDLTPYAKGSRLNIKTINGAYTVLQSDSGRVFMIDDNAGTSAYRITLPTTLVEGTNFKFVVRQAGSLSAIVTVDATGDKLHHVTIDGGGSNQDAEVSSAGTAKRYWRFTAAAVQGDYMNIWTDGTNWYGEAISAVNDGISTATHAEG